MAVQWGLPSPPLSPCASFPPACSVCVSPPRDALAVSLRLGLFVSASLQPMNDPLNGPTDPVCSHLPLPLLLPFPAKPFSPLQEEGGGGGGGRRPEPPSLNSRGWGSQAWVGMERARQRDARGGGGGQEVADRDGESREEKMGETELGKEREK